MKDMLIQLENNEAVLLMYLADELSAPDRARVQQMLARDKGMRGTFAELQADENRVGEMFQADIAAMPLNTDRCLSHTLQAMRHWQAAPPALRFSVPQREKRLPLPWWSYPLAAAASVLVASAVFVANIEPYSIPAPSSGELAINIPALLSSQAMADMGPSSADTYALAEDLAASFDEGDRALSDSPTETGMIAARHEVATLQALSQNAFASVDWRW